MAPVLYNTWEISVIYYNFWEKIFDISNFTKILNKEHSSYLLLKMQNMVLIIIFKSAACVAYKQDFIKLEKTAYFGSYGSKKLLNQDVS